MSSCNNNHDDIYESGIIKNVCVVDSIIIAFPNIDSINVLSKDGLTNDLTSNKGLYLSFYNYKNNIIDSLTFNHTIDSFRSLSIDLDTMLLIGIYRYFSEELPKYDRRKNRLNNQIIGLFDSKKISTHYIEEFTTLEELFIYYNWIKGDVDSSLYFLQKQANLFCDHPILNSFKYKNYYVQASIQRKKKDFIVAINHIGLAIKAVKDESIIDSIRLYSCYDLRANIANDMMKFDASYNDYLTSIQIAQSIDVDIDRLNKLYRDISNPLLGLNKFKEIESYNNKIIENSKSKKIDIGIAYKNMGGVKLKTGDSFHAETYLRKAVELLKHNNSQLHHYSESCYLLSVALDGQNKKKEAINYSEMSIAHCLQKGKLSFKQMLRYPESFKRISWLANLYSERYFLSLDNMDLEKAEFYFDQCELLLNEIRKYKNEDLVVINQDYAEIYYFNRLNFLYKYKEKRPESDIRAKSVYLINAYKAQAFQRNEMYISHNKELNLLNSSYRKNRKKLNELNVINESISNDSFLVLQKYCLDREKKLIDSINKFQYSLDNKKPEMYQAINDLAKDENMVIMDFFIPEITNINFGFLYIFNGKFSQLLKIEKIDELLIMANDYYIALQTNDIDLIKKFSYELNIILNPYFLHFSIEKTDRLVVIADNVLRKLPFESLIDKNGKYLIEKIPIQYAFSSNSLITGLESKRPPNKSILVFAYSNRQTLNSERNNYLQDELPGSFKESKIIEEIFPNNCTIRSGKEARKSTFLKEAKDYNIIHISLHGKADTENRAKSCLFFRTQDSIESLYPYELIDQNIYPNLVFLSACETASGELVLKEGMYSIAREFHMSGCENTISSLWELDDNASAQLVKFFYYFMKDNPEYSYAKLLQLAKVKYINESIGKDLSPSYWSSLVLYN